MKKTSAGGSRLILICGNDDFLKRRCLTQLLETDSQASDDFDFETFTSDSRPFAEWLASAGTAPFLSERRTVVVRNLMRLTELEGIRPDEIRALLPETARLILVADDEASDEGQRRRSSTEWEKIVNAAGGTTFRLDFEGKVLRDIIREEFAKSNKTISTKAIEALVEMSGGSSSNALTEIDKLVTYAGEEPEVRYEDIVAVISPAYDWNVFRMIDSALSGRRGEAQRQLRTLVGGPGKAEDAIHRNIFPVLSKQLRLIYQARVCLDAGISTERIPPEFAQQFPKKPNLATEADWSRKRATTEARSMPLDVVIQCLTLAAEADARIKGQLPGFTALDSVEQMLLQIAELSAPQPAI